jgi:enterobactin synthetase component D
MNIETQLDIPFFIEEGPADWFQSPSALHHCQFNLRLYDDVYFEHCVIEFPDTIRKAVPKRRAEFLAGRFCARRALEAIMHMPPQIPIGRDRNPVWPDSVKGSISHSNTNAVAVVTDSSAICGIGIDIENRISDTTISNLRAQIVLPDELKLFINSKLSDTVIFTIIFSVKESFFKAAYPIVKKYFDFDAISVLRIDIRKRDILFRINYNLHTSLQRGMLFRGELHMMADGSLATLVTLPRQSLSSS